MANSQHLEILKSGVDAWNAWRRENPNERPDLTKANLDGANLVGANLKEADLKEADLSVANLFGANLFGANLFGADLRKANLRKAKLSEAILERADLEKANLHGANLTEAVLERANLKGANLKGANLKGANLREADVKSNPGKSGEGFDVTDLSITRGLRQELVDSMIGDSGTILPPGIVRPKHWAVLPIHQPDAPFVLLAHDSTDTAFVADIRARLRDEDIAVWDMSDLAPGQVWRDVLAEKLSAAGAIVTLWTSSSVKNQNVIEEAETGLEKRKLIQVQVDGAKRPYGFGGLVSAALNTPLSRTPPVQWERLVDAIRNKLDPSRLIDGDRLEQSAPVKAVVEGDRVALRAPPTQAEPLNSDPVAKREAFATQIQWAAQANRAIQRFDDENNVPRDVLSFVEEYEIALNADPFLWLMALDNMVELQKACDLADVKNWPRRAQMPLENLFKAFEDFKKFFPADTRPQSPPIERDLDEYRDKLAEVSAEIAAMLQNPIAQSALDPNAHAMLTNENLSLSVNIHPGEFDLGLAGRQKLAATKALQTLAEMFASVRAALDPEKVIKLAEDAKSAVGEVVLDASIETYVKGRASIDQALEELKNQIGKAKAEAMPAVRTAGLAWLLGESLKVIGSFLAFFGIGG